MKAIKQFTIQCTEKQVKENPLHLIETMKSENERYLEYVIVVANEFDPSIGSEIVQLSDDPEDAIEEYSLLPSNAPYTFKKRYNSDKLQVPFTLNEYLKDEKIQSMLSDFQLDIEKFWYLMLYIYDNSYSLCQKGVEIDIDTNIDKIMDILDNQDKKEIIKIGEGKETIEIRDTISSLSEFIDWHKLASYLINQNSKGRFTMTEQSIRELQDLGCTKLGSSLKANKLANGIWSYDFTRKLLYFLNSKKIEKKISYKFIALILNFTELQVSYKSDNIKILLYKYQDYKFTSYNKWY